MTTVVNRYEYIMWISAILDIKQEDYIRVTQLRVTLS